jgi:hypothetical protein
LDKAHKKLSQRKVVIEQFLDAVQSFRKSDGAAQFFFVTAQLIDEIRTRSLVAEKLGMHSVDDSSVPIRMLCRLPMIP